MLGAKEMPSAGEEVVDHAVDGEEPLRVRRRFEPPHVVLPLAARLVGDLGAVVGVAPSVVGDGGHDDPMRGAVAPEAVGDEAVWLTAVPGRVSARASV